MCCQALNLEGFREDLTPVTSLTTLHHLGLRSCLMVDGEFLDLLGQRLPALAILDLADCPATSPEDLLTLLARMPVLWALGVSGDALSTAVVGALAAMPCLAHLYVDRPSQARLCGVTCREYADSDQSRNGCANLVRQYLATELPGRLREYGMFYRNGYVDFPDWDGWWLCPEDSDVLSDREFSDSDSSLLDSEAGGLSDLDEDGGDSDEGNEPLSDDDLFGDDDSEEDVDDGWDYESDGDEEDEEG